MNVVVCVATYRRPRMLAELLGELAAQTLWSSRAHHLGVVVVDNDPEESARQVAEAAASSRNPPLSYVVEAKRGIAHARNAAVAAALARGADAIAMIDDDEHPRRDWLERLLETADRHGAVAVYGPVLPRYPKGTPRWIRAGGFFERAVVPTGEVVAAPGTGNLLLLRRALAGDVAPFDPSFGLTGGEDTQFFRSLERRGTSIISCAEAAVEESVPLARTSMRYLLQRAYGAGSAYVAVERSLQRGGAWRLRRMVSGIARVLMGLGLSAWGWTAGMHRAARGLEMMALGAGTLAGLAGIRHERYRRTQGA